MKIVYITGNTGTGKTTALDAIHDALASRGMDVIHASGCSSPEGIRQATVGRPRLTLLVDDCPKALLHWLEQDGNLPQDCRVFVTITK